MRTVVLMRALAAALLVLGVACQTPPSLPEVAEDIGEAIDEAVRGGEEPPAPGEGTAPGDQPPAGEPPAVPEGVETAEGDAPTAPGGLALPGDQAAVGAMCRPYLRPDVPALAVEFHSQAGAEPSRGAVDHFVGVLGSVVDKPAGVSVTSGQVPGGAQTWTVDDLRAFAREHRTVHSSGDRLGLYVMSLRGRLDQGDILGVAFSATEFAIFPDVMAGLGSLLGGRAPLERAVLVHELGHLLCLVNVTYRSDIDHEHPDHPHHSSDQASVMYWAIETSAVARVFSGPPPDNFTANDRADLDGLRTGRY